MINFKNDEVKCDLCRCKPVCKEVNNWINYVKEIQELRKKYSLFDDKVNCPYYIEDHNIAEVKTKDEQADDMKTKAYKSLIKDSKGRDKYFKEPKKEEKKPLDKSKTFHYEYPDDCNFIDEDECCKARKLTEEDFAKVLERILNYCELNGGV